MTKRALIVGINYPDSSYTLRGCVNDALTVQSLLSDVFGFDDIAMLTDEQASTANIMAGLDTLVAGAQPGDVLHFHYSGHGSQMDDNADNDPEPDGLDEIICPNDLDWKTKVIRDDDLKRVFDRVPAGVNLTVVLDCCNSGGGMDHANQYQPIVEGEERTIDEDAKNGRYLPPPPGVITESAPTFTKKRALSRDINKTSLLISGCRSDQTSADAKIDGVWQGACTYYFNEIVRENPEITYRNLIDELNYRLSFANFTQRPELNGPERTFDRKFLAAYDVTIPDPVGLPPIDFDLPPPAAMPMPGLEDDDDDDKDDKKKYVYIGVGVVVLVGALLAIFL